MLCMLTVYFKREKKIIYEIKKKLWTNKRTKKKKIMK